MQILVLSTDFILFSFVRAKEKNQKRKLADCTYTAKMAHFFLSAARRPLRALIGAALLTEKDTPFLYAAPVRSG
jgi:hypothetical protein